MIAVTKLFVERELAGSLRARWFVAYAAIFLIGGMLLATFGIGDSVISGYRGYAKSFAGLVHLSLLFIPLMALFPAVAAIAGDEESGALDYVLAQPVTHGEVFVGKWAGVSAAVGLALTIGFGAAGAVATMRGVPPGLVAVLYGFVMLLGLAFVSVGMALSVLTRSRQRAATIGMIVWLGFVALGTLGIMVAFVKWGLPEWTLAAWSFINPVEAFRLGIISALDPDLSLLGPVGAGITGRFGSTGTMALAAGSLVLWVLVPLGLGFWWFGRR